LRPLVAEFGGLHVIGHSGSAHDAFVIVHLAK
jgi:hypothetical protein